MLQNNQDVTHGFAYLVYPWDLRPAPTWVKQLSELHPDILCYNPSISVAQQQSHLLEELTVANPIGLSKEFTDRWKVPPEFFLPSGEAPLKWESSVLEESIWRDLYFLVRCDIVIADLTLSHFGDNAFELVAAASLERPIISISDRTHVPPQMRYLSKALVSTNVDDIVEAIGPYLTVRKRKAT